MAQKRLKTRADLERPFDPARQLRAETLAAASGEFVAAAGVVIRRLVVRTVALATRRAWLPIATVRPASGMDGPSI